jgi:cytoskeletal protein CcmA (bactofilin family)
MFGKESDMKTDESKISTIIAKGTKIEGNIHMQGSLRIDGDVKGKVTSSETLTVGAAGVVDGEVHVKEAIVGGKIMGNLTASQKVELESNASILGDVKTRTFVIKEGGVFHGQCFMREEAAQKTKEKTTEPLKLEPKPATMPPKPGLGKQQSTDTQPRL